MSAVLEVGKLVTQHLGEFVKWPKEALLLWQGCVRKKYHSYPLEILELLRQQKVYQRNWSNDPAIHAYLLAEGERPTRNFKTFGWTIHHLYLGQLSLDAQKVIHAVKDGRHFTQSAGLVAVHPIADALYEEDADFRMLLRQESFKRFGYDPDGIFSSMPHDEFGFVAPHKTRILYANTNNSC
jgi:hypothetical protein